MAKFQSPFIPHNRVKFEKRQFDTEYVTPRIKDVVQKTGEGEEDFVVVQKITYEKTPIAEVLARDHGTTSIQAVIDRFALTGDASVLPSAMPKDGVTNDVTGCPEDLLEADIMAKRAVAAFDSLPDDLKKGRSFGDFCATFTQDEYAIWLAALAGQNKTEKVDKKDGD